MPKIRLCVLASGSKGNATVVQCGDRSFVIDCGICKRDFISRCKQLGVNLNSIEAILLTHDHSDHTKGLGVVTRGLAKEGIEPVLYASSLVRNASKPLSETVGVLEQRSFSSGDALSIAGMMVHPFKTSHDAAESFGFRIESESDIAGFMTDTGIVVPEAHDALIGCRLLALEANHDVQMLKEGPYPYSIKQRILGDSGHLSNEQSAQELEKLLSSKLEQVAAMHISENNNTYGIPVRALRSVIDRNSHPAQVIAALQHSAIVLE